MWWVAAKWQTGSPRGKEQKFKLKDPLKAFSCLECHTLCSLHHQKLFSVESKLASGEKRDWRVCGTRFSVNSRWHLNATVPEWCLSLRCLDYNESDMTEWWGVGERCITKKRKKKDYKKKDFLCFLPLCFQMDSKALANEFCINKSQEEFEKLNIVLFETREELSPQVFCA